MKKLFLKFKKDSPDSPDSRGINMVDLMMWLVIAALLLAAALQAIGYYQKATKVYLMQDEVTGVVSRVHAEASMDTESSREDVIRKVLEEHNNAHPNDDLAVSYGSVSPNAVAAPSTNGTSFSLVSAVTEVSPSDVLFLKAYSESFDDTYVVYFFSDTKQFKQGLTVVRKNAVVDPGSGLGDVVTPGAPAVPTDSPTAAPEPTVAPTTDPSPSATTDPIAGPASDPEPTTTPSSDPVVVPTPTPTPTETPVDPAPLPTTEPTASSPAAVDPTPIPTASSSAPVPTDSSPAPAPAPTTTTSPSPSPTPSPTNPPPASGPSIASAADIVAFDSSGALWNYRSGSAADGRYAIGAPGAAIPLDFFVTDWNGDGIQDLLVQGKDGTLILRKGLSTGGFTNVTIGTNGWATMEITVGKYKKTDTYPSVIAKDKVNNTLFYYQNTSGGGIPSRLQIGAGWGPYTPLNLVDWDQDGNMDIIAVNASDEMMLYRTDGAGTILNEVRKTIGTGWTFNSIHVIRGRGGVGNVGLIVRSASTGNLIYYPIYKNAFGTSVPFSGGWGPYKIAGN